MVCFHGGQGCATLTRLLLPRSRFDEGVELRGAGDGVRCRTATRPTRRTCMGPLISARAARAGLGLVEQGEGGGRQPVIGGRRPAAVREGLLLEPTLFADVDPRTPRSRSNEIFGPVLVVMPYEDDDDAVRIANDSVYGLSGAVYSGDRERSKAWPSGSAPAR